MSFVTTHDMKWESGKCTFAYLEMDHWYKDGVQTLSCVSVNLGIIQKSENLRKQLWSYSRTLSICRSAIRLKNISATGCVLFFVKKNSTAAASHCKTCQTNCIRKSAKHRCINRKYPNTNAIRVKKTQRKRAAAVKWGR